MRYTKDIAKQISDMNGRCYFVGGYVRDLILNRKSHDVDICVVGISHYDFEENFPEAKMTGKSFPVYRLETEYGDTEFAFARKERKISPGHSGFDVIFDKSVTLEQDLYRRDLTINAIAKDVLTGDVIDPFKGTRDLVKRTINAVSFHFLDDPLRALRAARFSSQLGFEISNRTYLFMNNCKEELKSMSQDRIVEELKKALASNYPSNFFKALKKADILETCFPYRLNLEQLSNVSNKTNNITLRFATAFSKCIEDDIKNLSSAYPNAFKERTLAVILISKLKDSHEDILKAFYVLKKYHTSAEDLNIILNKHYLNNKLYDSVMKAKFDIPNNLTGLEIRDFVKQERLKLLASLV